MAEGCTPDRFPDVKDRRMDEHDPQVMPLVDIADRWVVRCRCGCGLSEQFATEGEAQDRAAELRAEGAAEPGDRAQAVEEAEAESPERI